MAQEAFHWGDNKWLVMISMQAKMHTECREVTGIENGADLLLMIQSKVHLAINR